MPILRRAEFKRSRWYRRRERKRERGKLMGALQRMYAAVRMPIFPQFDCLIRLDAPSEMRWGGTGVYFDVVIQPDNALSGPLTTQATSQDAVPVNYDGAGRAPTPVLP